MTKWEDHELETAIYDILETMADDMDDEDHHLNPPFLTSYQIAIEFKRRHPEIADDINEEVGGEGIGQHTSLAQYISQQLSIRINSGEIDDIEGAFLSLDYDARLVYLEDDDEPIIASPRDRLAIFRIFDE